MSTKRDNSTFDRKALLRISALRELQFPVVLETHGGAGKLWARCYSHLEEGVVIEKQSEKCAQIARRRPTWAVYEGVVDDCIRHGVGTHLPVNFVDLNCDGDPWPTLHAFFEGFRPKVAKLVVVVSDGVRQKLQASGSWPTGQLKQLIEDVGIEPVKAKYLDHCRDLLRDLAHNAGYSISMWTAYHCGRVKQDTHWAAVLSR